MTIRYSILAFSALQTALPAATLQRDARNDDLDLVDAKENIRGPANYRDRYQALGSWSVVDSNNDTDTERWESGALVQAKRTK